jgi:hypothetical protein
MSVWVRFRDMARVCVRFLNWIRARVELRLSLWPVLGLVVGVGLGLWLSLGLE